MRKKRKKKPCNEVTAKSQGRPNLVNELQQREHRPPCQSTALAVLLQFSALSYPSTCRCTTTGVPSVQELHLKNLDGLLHSLHCVPVSVKQLHHHSVEELKLRHLHVLDENLLERSCVVTETSTTASATVAAASICIPPWPGGVELLKQGPCFPPPQGLHGHDCKSTTGSRRSPEQRTLRDGVLKNDRGHFDNLLGNNRQ